MIVIKICNIVENQKRKILKVKFFSIDILNIDIISFSKRGRRKRKENEKEKKG